MNDGAAGEFIPVPERGMRTKDWLYVRQPHRRKYLFDPQQDPNEMHNLVNNPEHTALMVAFDQQIICRQQEMIGISAPLSPIQGF